MNTAINFDNSYRRLPERFYSAQLPTPVVSPQIIQVNEGLAAKLALDLDWLRSDGGLAALAGNKIPGGAEPIATVYAGHQFGNWNPQLGDGRAVLLGELVSVDGERFDIQLKGSGRTPYSRGGDGRAPLGPVLREYIVSEAMFALGIPTSRSLAVVTSGEMVMREEALPGAVLTRIASSHIRIGTFQYFAARGDTEALKILADHVIQRHYPDASGSDEPYLALLEAAIETTATLVSNWQQVGFIHGVMNTDNMLLSGETIDYGPCAFMDTYLPGMVFSSIDTGGRYAYRNQPAIAKWNLTALAQCLLPLIADDEEKAVEKAKAFLDNFDGIYSRHYQSGMGQKIGLSSLDEQDEALVSDLLELMTEESMDYTLTFTALQEHLSQDITSLPESFSPWLSRWRARLDREVNSESLMTIKNPLIIPRNHRIEEVISSAVNEQDFQPFHVLVDVLRNPYETSLRDSHYAMAPTEQQKVHRTFCGT
ncbi:MAG: YdiU family protein [Pseudomonadales bacterium]